jgi:hypothetical protein
MLGCSGYGGSFYVLFTLECKHLGHRPYMNHHNGTPVNKLMNKKMLREVNEILERYSVLYTDWVPFDDGRVKKVVDENKKDLLLAAFLDLTFLIEKSFKK